MSYCSRQISTRKFTGLVDKNVPERKRFPFSFLDSILEELKTRMEGQWPEESDVDTIKEGILRIHHVYNANVAEVRLGLWSFELKLYLN